MKKIIGIVIASLVFCNVGFAEMKRIEDKEIRVAYYTRMATVCVDGYKFVISYTGNKQLVRFSFLKKEMENHFQRSVKK